jgi:hypothetical protein
MLAEFTVTSLGIVTPALEKEVRLPRTKVGDTDEG